ncbi:MAG: ribosome-associated translation inhibitor RaiA [Bacteroidales bacterium]|nr:ribosome-associated translation inhibitor RaiA [Bacteroidales bacterium]MDD4602831.1 ribosome-associated translation inhibitor RaiA [Bacteroidales bacterium]
MKVKINSVHFKVDKKLEDFINDRMEKLHIFFEGVIGSEVILKMDNTETRENKIAEIRLLIKGYDLFAKKEALTFEAAIDQATEALRKQLVKHKEKVRGS